MASARLMPIALTLRRTSRGPGSETWVSTNSRTSGPPAFANLIVRDMTSSRLLQQQVIADCAWENHFVGICPCLEGMEVKGWNSRHLGCFVAVAAEPLASLGQA